MTDFLRIIFPNWRFFSGIGHTYEILLSQDGGLTWDIAFPKHERKWSQLVWNPEINLQLALFSCCEQFVMELPNLTEEQLQTNVRLHTIEAMIFHKSPIHLKNQPWRFKIAAFLQGEELKIEKLTNDQVAFVSAEYHEDWSPS